MRTTAEAPATAGKAVRLVLGHDAGGGDSSGRILWTPAAGPEAEEDLRLDVATHGADDLGQGAVGAGDDSRRESVDGCSAGP